jgi:hypothetical protein
MHKVLSILGAIALVLVITTGAVAASGLITGANVKDGSLTGVDIKNGSVGAAKLSQAARAALHGMAGADGMAGAAGAKGDTGAAGSNGSNGSNGANGAAGATGATGAAGANGNTSVTNYKQTIMVPGADSSTPATVTLATIGPFTLTGDCYITSGTSVRAETVVTTSQDHAAVNDYEGDSSNDFNIADGTLQIGYTTTGSPGSPDFVGPNDGSTALASQDGSTVSNVFVGTGSYLGSGGGATVPACTFFGYSNTQ